MQSILADIVAFVARNGRTILLLGILIMIVYGWDLLSKEEWFYRWLAKINPKSALVHFHLGTILATLPGRKAEAESELRKAIALRPRYAWPYYALIALLYEQNKASEAQETLDRMLELFPQDGLVVALQAARYADQERFEEAETAWKNAVKLAPNFSQSRLIYGIILVKRNRYSEAERVLREAIRLEPSAAEAYYQLGKVFESTQRLADAEASYRKAIRLAPGQYEAYLALWELFDKQGRYLEAEAFYKKAASRQNDPDIYPFICQALEKQGKLDEAKKYVIEILEIDPEDIWALHALAYTLAKTENFAEAEKAYRQAITQVPNDASLYQDFGKVLSHIDGRQTEAEQAYRKSIELDPACSESYVCLGVSLQETKRGEEAEACYRKAIELEPSNGEYHRYLGNLFYGQNRLEDARQMYEKAVALNPNDLSSLNVLSQTLREAGQLTEALSLAQKAFELAPNEFILSINIASLQRSMGNIEEAKKYVEISRQLLNKDEPDYWYNLACMEAIVNSHELAFDYLEKAREAGHLDPQWAWEDPDLQWLRNDPRFAEIVGPKPETKNSEA